MKLKQKVQGNGWKVALSLRGIRDLSKIVGVISYSATYIDSANLIVEYI